jgi:hypothetical protein
MQAVTLYTGQDSGQTIITTRIFWEENSMKDLPRSYFERRLLEERRAAASASNKIVKLTHLSFTHLYEARLSASYRTSPSMTAFNAPKTLEENTDD